MLEKNKYDIWLSAVKGIGGRNFRALCTRFGDARGVYENADHHTLQQVNGVGKTLAEYIMTAKRDGSLDKNLEAIIDADVSVYIAGTEDYPNLDSLHDPPPVLYAKGCMPLKNIELGIAIVGTRRCTRYGRGVAERLSEELARESAVVISGLARGIDTHAHIGALRGGGFTVAVLGCGVDVIYPPENKRLYMQIMDSGAVVSEFFPGTAPYSSNFPLRNRIISAMCRGLVVVESAAKGGALITVDSALEQGKDVFAVPGNIDSPSSEGCNKLIREGAIPVTRCADIMAEYGIEAATNEKRQIDVEMTSEESNITQLLVEGELQYDILAGMTGMSNASLASCLTIMELKGIIKQLPGRVYTMER